MPQPGWIGARRRVGSLSEGRSSRRPPLRIGSNRLSINIRLDQLSRMHCANSNCSISCSREFDQIVVGDRVDNQEPSPRTGKKREFPVSPGACNGAGSRPILCFFLLQHVHLRKIVYRGLHHVKACEGLPCTPLFVDQTRGHARKWCGIAVCGNRARQLLTGISLTGSIVAGPWSIHDRGVPMHLKHPNPFRSGPGTATGSLAPGRDLPLPELERGLWVTGGKTPSEYIFSELPQAADIAERVFTFGEPPRIADHGVLGPSDFRLSSGPIISIRWSRIDWLCSAKRALVWVTGGTRCRVN